MIARKCILALSRDRGSTQAILPVIKALQSNTSLKVTVASMEVSRSLLHLYGVDAEYLDPVKFTNQPARSIAELFDFVSPDLVLSGSSPAKGFLPETPEQYGILESRNRGIASITVLDFWGMYNERFVPFGDHVSFELLPDILCVLDENCRQTLFGMSVPLSRMIVTHNPWLDGVVYEATNLPQPLPKTQNVGGLCVLFISQPLAEMGGIRPWSYDQKQVLSLLLEALPFVVGKTHRVLIWIHPAEHQDCRLDKVSHIRQDVEIVAIEERGAQVMAYVDLVVSSHSTATYEGLYYGTPSISLRPGGNCLRPMYTDELGLSMLFSELELLKEYLENFDSSVERQKVLKHKQHLLKERLFFNDGNACDRVCEVVRSLLFTPR